MWLAFLLAGLSVPLTYLLQAPVPVGTGLLRVFGGGGLIGAGVGAIVRVSCSPMFIVFGWWSRIRATIGCMALGAFGGAGCAAWLDQLHIVGRQAVELPIVTVEELPARRRGSRIAIATLRPLDPTGQEHVAADYIEGGQVREGDCLAGTLERGWLGGVWVRHYAARACSAQRGVAGSHVIVPDNRVAAWRWHQPRDVRAEGRGRALDEALPVGLTCRVRPGGWLYRCSSR